MIRRSDFLLLALGAGAAASGIARAQTPPAKAGTPAKPINPVTGIFDAFKTYSIVALAEGSHGNQQGHDFRLALLRDPRFADTVNDILVEFGNSRHQDVMDRYTNGEAVSDAQLRPVWGDTLQMQSVVADLPIWTELARTVREVNAKRPAGKKLRILLGEPPIDWAKPDRSLSSQRDTFVVGLVQREVVQKGRRCLIVFGGVHLMHNGFPFTIPPGVAQPPPGAANNMMVTQLNKAGIKVFSIWTNIAVDLATLQPNIATWPTPSLVLLRGTVLGTEKATTYVPPSSNSIVLALKKDTGGFAIVRPDPERAGPMENEFEALLYLGPPSAITYSKLDPALCADSNYLAVKRERGAMVGFPATSIGNDLKKFCGA